MQTYPTDAMLALVEQSPAAVASHNRDAWLALFARRATVEDPVGSRPVTRPPEDSIARFYDTFIAPNNIRFEVSHDFCGGNTVVRDLLIHIDMAPAVPVSVPMHLAYELTVEEYGLRIQRLAAHWELLPMVGQLLRLGMPAVPVMLSLSRRMLANLGTGGMLGFSRAALTPRRRHYRLLDELLTAINCQDATAVKRCFSGGEGAIVDGGNCRIPLAALKGIRAGKRIAAGSWISASVTVAGQPGVLFGETCPTENRLLRCQLYQ